MGNPSGIIPFDTRVVILPDKLTETYEGTSIIRPDTIADKEKWAQTKATLIAVGDNAFIEWGDGAQKPKPGDRVIVAKYAGTAHKGPDGEDYTLANDEDVLGLWLG